jgi:hypothetical protein
MSRDIELALLDIAVNLARLEACSYVTAEPFIAGAATGLAVLFAGLLIVYAGHRRRR